MTEFLDTYDKNWQTRYNRVQGKIDRFYASKRNENGHLDMDTLLKNEFFRMRQKELREEEVRAELAQFKTLEECVAYHEVFLKEEIDEYMSEYITQKGHIRDERDRFMDHFSRALMGLPRITKTAKTIPEPVQALTKLQNQDQLKTAQEVLDQFDGQYDRLESDFKAAMVQVEQQGVQQIKPRTAVKPPQR